MKIFISADMEGVSGITHPAQCRPNHADYPRFRRLMTQEVNAAVAGAVEAGATEVVVNDGHLTMTNLVIEEMHPAAALISGSNKLHGQMDGLDDTFDGVFFVGYHEGDGLGDGLINHTLSSLVLRAVHVNDDLVDEAGINARMAAAYGVPVLLLTGDDRVCTRAKAEFPGIEVAAVKRAIDRLAAESLSVESARALIAEKAAAAVRNAAGTAPFAGVDSGPTRFQLEFRSTSAAQICTLFPGIERRDPRTVAFERPTYVEAFRQFWGLVVLGLAAHDGIFGRGY
jgi:D-amino peptidase